MTKFTVGCKLSGVLLIALMLSISACKKKGDSKEKGFDAKKSDAVATTCQECHENIFNYWSKSRHANSTQQREFQAAYAQANERYAELREAGKGEDLDQERDCLGCHAPTDPAVEVAAPNGIACAFCHSAKEVNFGDRKHPYVLDSSGTKYGPLKDRESPAHPVEYSPLFETSKVCAGCHQYTNSVGVTILNTFGEWETYRERGGKKICQDCHMPTGSGAIVKTGLVKPDSMQNVNSHEMPGSHSPSQLHESVDISDLKIDRGDDSVKVSLKVVNKTGHSFPTGKPTRKVIARATLELASKEVRTEEKELSRLFAGPSGSEIIGVNGLFVGATRMIKDDWIEPMGQEFIEIELPLKQSEAARLQVQMIYVDDPAPNKVKAYEATFYTRSRELFKH